MVHDNVMINQAGNARAQYGYSIPSASQASRISNNVRDRVSPDMDDEAASRFPFWIM